MNEPRTLNQHELDLLNGGVDGELSAAEQEELQELLAHSSEARKFKEELLSIAQTMEDLPGLEPPKYLQESIERQIRLPSDNKATAKKQGFGGGWLTANWLRTGFALAAGVVLTIIVYEIGSGPISEQDATNLVGTVVKNREPAKTELLDKIFLTDDPVIGFIELHKSDDLLTLDMLLSSDVPIELIVDFGDRGLEFEDMTSMPRQLGAATLDTGLLSIVVSGERHYTLRLRSNTKEGVQKATPLELAFYADDKLVQKAEVEVSRQ